MNYIISKLVKKHKTRDPFEIASNLGIIVLFEELGSINGYYNTAFRQKFIHINCDLPCHQRRFTAAHELGHAILHPKANTPFLRDKTYMSVDKFEIEANKFAVNLIIPDEILEEHNEYTIGQIAMMYGYPDELIQLRLVNKVQGKFKVKF